jgi:1,4-dihydroxy-2-naphthoate polyprenyltransferase
LPVNSLNVGTADEIVTFEIVPRSQIQRPMYLVYLSHLIKLRSYLLIMVPLFFVAAKNYLDDRFLDPVSFLIASVSMLFLYAGLNLRSDLNDHVSGYDRVLHSSSPKPLLKGWITGAETNFLSWILIFVSAVLSVPVFILQHEEIRVVSVVLILFILGQFFKKNSFKNQRFGEVILFLLMGPGLCSAYQVALGSGIDTEVLAFGVFWGTAILFLVHLNNFSHLLTSSQAGIHNTMNKMGFDSSKKFLTLWLVLVNILWIWFHALYAGTFWTWFSGITLVFWSVPTAILFSNISSPVGSDLVQAKKTGHKNFVLMIALLILEQMWYLGSQLI